MLAGRKEIEKQQKKDKFARMVELNKVKMEMLQEEKNLVDLKNWEKLEKLKEQPDESYKIETAIVLSRPLAIKPHSYARVKDQSQYALAMKEALDRNEARLAQNVGESTSIFDHFKDEIEFQQKYDKEPREKLKDRNRKWKEGLDVQLSDWNSVKAKEYAERKAPAVNLLGLMLK
jgi:hypothetical protein